MAGGSLNKVIIIGNLGKDPEVRRTQDGREIANMVVATSDTWKDKNTGEKRERTEWHRISIYNENLVNIAKNYLKKGSKVYLEGQIQTRKWTDQSGQERYSTDIVLQGFNAILMMLDSRSRSDDDYGHNAGSHQSQQNNNDRRPVHATVGPDQGEKYVDKDLDDDIPF